MANPYWSRLTDSWYVVHRELDSVLYRFAVRPMGAGYADIIVPRSKADQFLADLTRLGVAAHMVTLWCEASDSNKQRYGCPHGMGGPVQHGVWFSEMCERDPFDVKDHGVNVAQSQMDPFELARECNSLIANYVSTGMKERAEYSPCLAPGLTLAVPDNWAS